MKIEELDIQEAKVTDEEKKLKAELRKLGLSSYEVKQGKIHSATPGVNVKYRPEMSEDENFVKDGKLVHVFGEVNADFICRDMGLTSLEGCPHTVGGAFDCSVNHLTTLEHGPTDVDGDYLCTQNQITSLEGIQDIIHQIGGGFYFSEKKVKKGGLYLTQIKRLKKISDAMPQFKIIARYLGKPDQIFDCQQELIEAGFDEIAE